MSAPKKTLSQRLSEKWSGSGDYVTPWEALCGLVKARIISRDEARKELGLEPDLVLGEPVIEDGKVVGYTVEPEVGTPERLDEIEALRRENTRLTAELDAAKSALAHAKNALC